MIDKDIILAFMTVFGSVASALLSIWYVRARTRGNVDMTKATAESERQRRADESRQQTLEAIRDQNKTINDLVTHFGAIVETMQQAQEINQQTIAAQSKTTTEVHDIAETLETAAGMLSGLDQSVEAYQKKGLTAIETVQTIPDRIDGVKSDIADTKKAIAALPASLRDELKPVTDKLASLDKHVEDMAADLKHEIGQIRSDVMTLIKAALAPVVPLPPEPSFVTTIAGATAEPGATA